MAKKKLKFNISPSCLDMALDCPYLWAKLYVEKKKYPEVISAPLLIGNSFHSTVEQFYKDKKYEGEGPEWVQKNVVGHLYDHYHSNKKLLEEGLNLDFCKYRVRKQADNWAELAKREGWLREPEFVDGKPGIEIYYKVPYEGHHKYEFFISGKIDLLIRDKNNKLCIVDWKTGKFQDDPETTIQLVFYSAALYKILEIEEDRNCLVYVEKGNIKEAGTRQEKDYLILKEKIEKALKYLEDKKFPLGAEIGECVSCRWCPITDCKHNKA